MKKDKELYKYQESKTPLDKHKYSGWFYHHITKKFYRWNDVPFHIKENNNGHS